MLLCCSSSSYQNFMQKSKQMDHQAPTMFSDLFSVFPLVFNIVCFSGRITGIFRELSEITQSFLLVKQFKFYIFNC